MANKFYEIGKASAQKNNRLFWGYFSGIRSYVQSND